ncbi:MAG: dihydrofolate reductase [Candidatus Pacebacteria bacterium]|nr:dihydrofolate reductase [Candidatus Paceibacterota bacterium]
MFEGKKVITIGAFSKDFAVYSKNGGIPWRIPEEQQHFKAKTMGHAVIMGRKSWESLPSKMRPLPGRENVVITRSKDFEADGARVVTSLEEAIHTADSETVFVTGGRNFWIPAMDFADEAWITVVHIQQPETEEVLLHATEMLHLQLYWPQFELYQVDRKQPTESTPGYDVQHWIRQ